MGEQNLLEDQIAGSTFTVTDGEYDVLSAASLDCLADRDVRERCFAAVHDPDLGEYTLYVRAGEPGAIPSAEDAPPHGGYRLIRFNLLIPFEGVGFIAALARAIAGKGANLLAVSAYSCDYILVKEADREKAVLALRELGMREDEPETARRRRDG